jgi:hypothetical protein
MLGRLFKIGRSVFGSEGARLIDLDHRDDALSVTLAMPEKGSPLRSVLIKA